MTETQSKHTSPRSKSRPIVLVAAIITFVAILAAVVLWTMRSQARAKAEAKIFQEQQQAKLDSIQTELRIERARMKPGPTVHFKGRVQSAAFGSTGTLVLEHGYFGGNSGCCVETYISVIELATGKISTPDNDPDLSSLLHNYPSSRGVHRAKQMSKQHGEWDPQDITCSYDRRKTIFRNGGTCAVRTAACQPITKPDPIDRILACWGPIMSPDFTVYACSKSEGDIEFVDIKRVRDDSLLVYIQLSGMYVRREDDAISPANNVFARIFEDSVVVWEIPSGRRLPAFRGVQRYGVSDRTYKYGLGNSEYFNPDGSTIAVRADDNQCGLFDIKTGRLIQLIEGTFLRFSPDGNFLITSSQEGTIQIWTR